MSRISSVFIAGSVIGLALAGPVTSASAHHYRHGCHHCAAPGPVYRYKTIYRSKYVNRYRDVSVSRTVRRPYHVYHVTRVQPVIHVNEVTRVHHHTYFHNYPVYRSVVQHLPPIRTVRHSVRNDYHCHCGGY